MFDEGECQDPNNCPKHGTDTFKRREWLLSVRDAYLEMNDWTTPTRMPKDIYAFIMFLGERYHAYWMGPELSVWQHMVFFFYLKKLPTGVFVKLCPECFEEDDNWANFEYFKSQIHEVLYETQVLEKMQRKSSWCSNCVTMPLFEMYDRETCKTKWGGHNTNHARNPMFWGFNELFNESEESDAYCEYIVSAKHPRA